MPDPAFIGVRTFIPITNADEDALRAARPRVAAWVDKLRRAGHVVFVRKKRMASGTRPNEWFRIDVDGRSMSVWELWARFRSELGDDHMSPGQAGRTLAPLTRGRGFGTAS